MECNKSTVCGYRCLIASSYQEAPFTLTIISNVARLTGTESIAERSHRDGNVDRQLHRSRDAVTKEVKQFNDFFALVFARCVCLCLFMCVSRTYSRGQAEIIFQITQCFSHRILCLDLCRTWETHVKSTRSAQRNGPTKAFCRHLRTVPGDYHAQAGYPAARYYCIRCSTINQALTPLLSSFLNYLRYTVFSPISVVLVSVVTNARCRCEWYVTVLISRNSDAGTEVVVWMRSAAMVMHYG